MIVLDTHAWIWLVNDDLGQLPRSTQVAIEADDDRRIAAISAWEVGMLVGKGRLALDRPLTAWVRAALQPSGVAVLPMDERIATSAAELPDFHGDPADRMIVASALEHGAALATRDRTIRTWARRHGLRTP